MKDLRAAISAPWSQVREPGMAQVSLPIGRLTGNGRPPPKSSLWDCADHRQRDAIYSVHRDVPFRVQRRQKPKLLQR